MKGTLSLLSVLVFLSPFILGYEQETRPLARRLPDKDSAFYFGKLSRLNIRQESSVPTTAPKASPKGETPKSGGTGGVPKTGGAGAAPKAGGSGAAPKGGSEFSQAAKGLPNFSGPQGQDLKKPKSGYGAAGGIYTGTWSPTRVPVV